jgi:hypothetical protein
MPGHHTPKAHHHPHHPKHPVAKKPMGGQKKPVAHHPHANKISKPVAKKTAGRYELTMDGEAVVWIGMAEMVN